jgi:hypothetical protein
MKPDRKVNSNAKLKTLPEERQAMIADYARDHSLDETVKWLGEDGLETSTGALSQFLSWYVLGRQLEQNESTVKQVLADLAKNNPGMAQEELDRAGQLFFSALAIQQQDSLTWKRIKDAATREKLVALNRDKFEFDAVAECRKQLPQLQAVESNRKLSDKEKSEAIHKILFPK